MLAGSLVPTGVCKHWQIPGSRRNTGRVEPFPVRLHIQNFAPSNQGLREPAGDVPGDPSWGNIKFYPPPYKYQNHITDSVFHSFIQSQPWMSPARKCGTVTTGHGMYKATQGLDSTQAWKMAAEVVNFCLFSPLPDVTGFKHWPVVKLVL